MARILQYIHRPNLTELGMGNTHDRYLVGPEDKLKQIFPLGVTIEVVDVYSDKKYSLYSKFENNEFRIKLMGDICDDYHLEPGDEVIFTRYESKEGTKTSLQIVECGRVFLNPGKRENGIIKDFEIVNLARLPRFSKESGYSCEYSFLGVKHGIKIEFSETRRKRTDSPVLTDFYTITYDGKLLESKNSPIYYLSIRNDSVILKSLQKYEFNVLMNEDCDKKEHKEGIHLQQIFYGDPSTEYIQSYLTALRTKPFMLLAGISGTGKSRIVRKLAQASTTQKYDKDEDRWKDNRPENFELMQVKPNWHNSMDVVGFYSNISKKYEFTPFVEFVVKAWQHKDTPYFLCLDEMNLAPVEEYFAEFLSAIESRSTDENGEYTTDPIIKPFKEFGKDVCEDMLRHLLGEAHHTESNPLAEQFTEKGLTLPPNLMVMGTVNMDETTFSFSRKVLDRAMSVEMNEVDYDKFLSGESEQFPLLKDINDLLVKRPQQASEVRDKIDSKRVISYLKTVNSLLDGTPFKLGYRAANEAMLYVAASRDFAGEKFSIYQALDEFTLMKILSRIEGDDNRLAVDENNPILEAIGKDSITDAGEDRINLLNCLRAIVRKHIGSNTETEKKINIMYRTLEREHFVSYWA